MNCANHPEMAAAAYCRECGKPICAECIRPASSSVYCAEHAPVTASVGPELPPPPASPPPSFLPPIAESPYTSPYTAAAPAPQGIHTHPLLALFLGFIPGVGAIYNGQYAKGLIHAVVFGMLVTMINKEPGGAVMLPMLGIILGTWVFYMAIEAFHTARKRRQGVAVEEFSSLIDVQPSHGRLPVGALALIGIGVVLLLDTTEIIHIEDLSRYWPVGLIGLGLYMLYNRVSAPRSATGTDAGTRAEAQR